MASRPPQILLTDRLDQLFAPPRSLESDVASLLQVLYDRRYTGPITWHFLDGVPKLAEFPAPKIKLCTGSNGTANGSSSSSTT